MNSEYDFSMAHEQLKPHKQSQTPGRKNFYLNHSYTPFHSSASTVGQHLLTHPSVCKRLQTRAHDG